MKGRANLDDVMIAAAATRPFVSRLLAAQAAPAQVNSGRQERSEARCVVVTDCWLWLAG